MNTAQLLGSNTAKNGFKNEDDIVRKFNDWTHDDDAKKWLLIMDYNLAEIEKVEAVKVHGHKTDVQVRVLIFLKNVQDVQNISVKLVSNKAGFNQIDKRWVNKYVELWNISPDVAEILKRFTGESSPRKLSPRDKRREFFDEMSKEDQNKILDFFRRNKILIVSDIIKGREPFSAAWMLVAQKINADARWTLKPINVVLNHYGQDDVLISPRGSLTIGRIGMQRKGGDGGRETAKMLQFKIDPCELFNL